MRILFAGTPDIAKTILAALQASEHEVLLVLTQPDRPAGRGQKLQQSAVKIFAAQAALPVLQPNTLKDPSILAILQDFQADLMVVVAYGLMLPAAVLNTPKHGCWNVHVSLLPRWRGAAPIQRALEAGDTETGVSIMQMDVGLDTGPILLQKTTPIFPDDHAEILHHRLADLGAEALLEALTVLQHGQLAPKVQSIQGVTYAEKLTKAEGRLDFSLSALALDCKLRAFYPWPMMVTEYNGTLFKIGKASVVDTDTQGYLGQIIEVSAAGIIVQTAKGRLRLEALQRPGGKMLSLGEFLRGHKDYFVLESTFS